MHWKYKNRSKGQNGITFSTNPRSTQKIGKDQIKYIQKFAWVEYNSLSHDVSNTDDSILKAK